MKHVFLRTLRGRFLIITITIMLAIGIGVSTLAYAMSSKNLHDNQLHATQTNLQFLSSNINSHMNNILALSKWSCSNDGILSYLQTTREAAAYNTFKSNAFERLHEQYLSTDSGSYIERIIIAGTNRDDYLQITSPEKSTGKSLVPIIQNLPYYQELITASDYDFSIGPQPDPISESDSLMLPILRPVESSYKKVTIGFSFIQVSLSLFTTPLKEFSLKEGSPVYLSIAGEVFCISGTKVEKEKAFPPNAIEQTLSAKGCSIALPMSTSSLWKHSAGYLILLAMVLLSTLIMGIILYYTLNRSVSRPVSVLLRRLSFIASGDFTQDPSIEWDNELGDIGRSINQLSMDIKELMEQKITFEKEKKDYEYQVLQSQINPHFLYNTLNSIKWMATIQNAPGIAEMTTSLSHLLKSIAKGTSTIVSIQDELNLLEDYFTIQKYRYGGALTISRRIEDETLLKIQVLRFTLQPIVENAIFHGIEPKGAQGHIDLEIYRCQGGVRIDITDDGIGMKMQTIENILSQDTTQRSHFFKQIGIGSVNKRIKYNFGETYGLSIKSEVKKYTTMSVFLPEIYINTKEEGDKSNDKTIDS